MRPDYFNDTTEGYLLRLFIAVVVFAALMLAFREWSGGALERREAEEAVREKRRVKRRAD